MLLKKQSRGSSSTSSSICSNSSTSNTTVVRNQYNNRYYSFGKWRIASHTARAAATVLLWATLPSLSFETTITGGSATTGAGDGGRFFSSSSSGIMIEQYPHLTVHHYQGPVGSTQDEARKLLQTHAKTTSASSASSFTALALIADQQTAGRGTNGRKWEAAQGNLFLTVCLPMDKVPVLLTLLPLQVGVLVAQRIEQFLEACSCQQRHEKETETNKISSSTSSSTSSSRVYVKWPNDVLINDKKVSGTLIESEIVKSDEHDNNNNARGGTWLLIGIGVNVAYAPNLSQSPGKQIRPATCIQDHVCCRNDDDDYNVSQNDGSDTTTSNHTEDQLLPLNSAIVLGKDLAQALVQWTMDDSLNRKDKGKKVVDDWISFAKFGETLQLRGTVEEESTGYFQGENVTVLGIQDDGQLIVRGADGRQRTLIADYMY